MFYTKDHKSIDMFDQFAFLGEKRRRLLDSSWAKIFREEILHNLPADKLAGVYHEFFGRPTKEIPKSRHRFSRLFGTSRGEAYHLNSGAVLGLPEPVLVELPPPPEDKKVKPMGDGKTLCQMPVTGLVEEEMQPCPQ